MIAFLNDLACANHRFSSGKRGPGPNNLFIQCERRDMLSTKVNIDQFPMRS